ncbi:MAG: FGGY-family carbohydrate kinase [Thermoleophilaceae bacterium]
MSEHALGFDVGLSGVRATVVRDDGLLVASARRAHERALLGDGMAEHDPADWLEGVERAGREAVKGAGGVPIAGIGVAALGPAPVLVDDDLRPLTTAPLFGLDRRAEPQRRRMAAAAAEDQAAATLDNALPKLAWWIERDPSLADRATWALDATGFVVGSLSGVPVMDSITARDYRLPGVDAPVPSPAPVDPLASAGRLQPVWAERLGVPAGLPVIAGTYDSFVDIAAAGVRGPGDSGLVLGSTMIVCRATGAELDPPPGLGASAYPGEGTLIGGWTLAGGLVLDWFEARFGGGEDLTAAAVVKTEQSRLLALPYLAGERTPLWDPLARGALVGLTPDVGPAEVYRALVESLALVVLDHAERLEQALGPAVSWRVTGGGVRNELWLQATADALGAPLEIPPDAAKGVGPSLLALRALGLDPERRPTRTVAPDPRRSERLRGRLTLFRELSRLVAPTVHELLADPGLEETLR